MVPLIKEMCKLQGREAEWKRFIADDKYVRLNSATNRWRCKGIMERFETTRVDDPSAPNILTFDGHIMRKLSGDRREGHISSETNASAKGGRNPFTFVYYCQDRRLSDLVADGKEYRISRKKLDGREVITLSFLQAKYDNYGLAVTFEPPGRVIEWRWYPASHSLRQEDRGKRDLNGIYRLLDYRSHPNPDGGELIWFPHRAEDIQCMGTLPTGQVVEWASKTMIVKDIQFNVDIPDSMFTQEFPPEAQVWDGLSSPRQRLLPPGVRPAAFDPHTRPWWHWAALTIAIVAVIIALGYVGGRIIRRRAPSAL